MIPVVAAARATTARTGLCAARLPRLTFHRCGVACAVAELVTEGMYVVRPRGGEAPCWPRRPVGVCSCTAQGSDESNAASARVGAEPPSRWLIPMELETARQGFLGAVPS